MAAGTTEAGRRLRDMMDILRKRAPRLRPNTVPRSCWPYFEDPQLAAWAPGSEAQRRALAVALAAERRKALGGAGAGASSTEEDEDEDGDGVRLALVAEVDADAGVCHIKGAKYVSEVEADLHSVVRILNLHSRGESEELRLRLEHFLFVNQQTPQQHAAPAPSSPDPLRDAQEIYTLAYAITVCLSAAPAIKCVVGAERAPLPLAASVDAAGLVRGLFAAGAAGAAGAAAAAVAGSGEGKGRKGKGGKRKGGVQEQEEQQEQEEEEDEEEGGQEGGGGGGPGKKKRRRKQKKGGGK